MRHVWAFLLKLAFTEAIAIVVLSGLARFPVGQSFMVGLVTAVLLYILGDLVVLPNLGNTSATIADAGVAFLIGWLAPMYTTIERVAPLTALVFGVAVGIAEYYFHSFLRRSVLEPPAAGDQTPAGS
ncbi:MAG TPA: DUF2512 family protein [Limnochordia bacterium]